MMKRFLASTITLSLLLTTAAAVQAQTPDRRPGIAVFPFTNGGSYGEGEEDLSALEVGVQQMLLTELAQNPELRIVERSVLRELIEEQDLGTSGRVDPQTAAEVGRLVGARYVITGVFADLYGAFRLDGRVIDVETGEILRTERVNADREELYKLIIDLSSEIMAGADLPPLPAGVEDARRERAEEIPAEATTLYSQALVYEDYGQTDQAIELYRRIAREFPAMTEAEAALEQLEATESD